MDGRGSGVGGALWVGMGTGWEGPLSGRGCKGGMNPGGAIGCP